METHWIAFILSLLMQQVPCQGIQFNECDSSGWIKIEEGTHNISLLSCTGLDPTDTVLWDLNITTIGFCETGPDNCISLTNVFKVDRPTNECSRLILVRPAAKPFLDGKFISCYVPNRGHASCNTDFIIRAKEMACSANFIPGTWNVTATCTISNFYSTRRNYTCLWNEWINNTSKEIDDRFVQWMMPISFTNSSYNRATCEMNKPLPDIDGEYNYTMKFSPVTEDVNANFVASNAVYKPQHQPSMNCTNSTYAVEGKELVCTCDASDLGQPPGRLVLYWNNSVTYGNYDVRSLLQKFDRVTRQYNGNILKCVVDWASGIELIANYTARVAYGPDNVSIIGPEEFEVHPDVTRSLNISCVYSDAKPTVSYQWSGHCKDQTSNLCSFTPKIADDGLIVVCAVSNSLARVTLNASFPLRLQYPPPNPPVISGYSGELLYTDQPKAIFCNVSGGNPPVTNVTFNCQDRSYTNNGQGINIQFIPNSSYNGKNCTCRAFWKYPDWYGLTAAVTLLFYSAPSQINMTINSTKGNNSVTENEVLTFKCHAFGRPTPKLLLFKNNISQAIFEVQGGVLNAVVEESVLSYILPSVRCEDTAVYTCTANNDDKAAPISVMEQLYVMCKPRYTTGDIPVIIFEGYPVSATLRFVAYPAPTIYNISFWGPSRNIQSVGDTIQVSLFQVDCWTSDSPYDIQCNLTVDNITSKSQAGYYRLSVENEYGIGNVDFQVKINNFINPSDSDASTPAAIGGGVCAAIIVIAIIVSISVLLKRRTKGTSNGPNIISKDINPDSTTGNKYAENTSNEDLSRHEYESLKMQEIGLSPSYEDLRKCKNEIPPKKEEADKIMSRYGYEDLRIQNMSDARQYENLQQSKTSQSAFDSGHVYVNS